MRDASAREMVLGAMRTFWREYLSRGGYRDGTTALAVAVTRAYYRFLALAKAWDAPAAATRVEAYERSKRRLLGLEPDPADRQPTGRDDPTAPD